MNLRASGFILLLILAAERHPTEAQTSRTSPGGMPPSGSPPDRTLPSTLLSTPNSASNAEHRPKESYNPLKNCVPPEDPTSYQNRLQEYQASLESDPSNSYLLQQLGVLHSRLLQWDEAQNYFFKALTHNKTKRHPDENQNSEIYRQLGDLYACQQQFDKAIDQYKQSIRSTPQDLADLNSVERLSDVKHNLALTQLLAKQQHQKGKNQQSENDQTSEERHPKDLKPKKEQDSSGQHSAEDKQGEQKTSDQASQSNSDQAKDQPKESKSSQSSASDDQKENSEAVRRPNEKSQSAFLSRQQAEQLLNSVSENRKKFIQRLLRRQPTPPPTDKNW